jgi:tyrosyl-tRNA synthetase
MVLLGGGTTKIGDPTGKDEARKMLHDEEIASNTKAFKKLLGKFLHFGEDKNDAIMVNNADWLSTLGYIDFLRDCGRHFSVNRMLTMDSVKLRLEREQNLSFLELNYMLLQAYDFVYLNQKYGCMMQMGGSDQWGNIVMGVELQRRMGGVEVFGLTSPLVTTSSGQKMGKTVSGAVWLSEDMVSPYEYWQYWRNTDDRDVGKFLRFFTELPLAEIEELERDEADVNRIKTVLANETTRLCHGPMAALEAAETARKIFSEGDWEGEATPSFVIEYELIQNGMPIFDLLKTSGMCKSGSEARKLIRSGAVRINDVLVEDETDKVSPGYFTDKKMRLALGKKKHLLVVYD